MIPTTVPAALPREIQVEIKEKRPERGTATPDFPNCQFLLLFYYLCLV